MGYERVEHAHKQEGQPGAATNPESFMESELEIISVTKASTAPVEKDAVSGSNVISATPNGSNSQQDEDVVITEPYKEGGKNK